MEPPTLDAVLQQFVSGLLSLLGKGDQCQTSVQREFGQVAVSAIHLLGDLQCEGLSPWLSGLILVLTAVVLTRTSQSTSPPTGPQGFL